ncbi:hypothetical protein KUTeg_015030 [Tegillarca granosa]|uniref:receptor protein serine/threonine kinase n=1 Tax=Tegillarca granosa TaxID=220873 RepID=A0ABQ9ERE6_TEGGR|nr:hypothetical protein KUTeg_015030 [Tegillarca granosa]
MLRIVVSCWSRNSNPEEWTCDTDICYSQKHRKLPSQDPWNYCCCYGNFCNLNMSAVSDSSLYTSENSVTPAPFYLSDGSYKEKTIIISLVSVCSVALITVGIYLLYRLCLSSNKPSPDSLNLVEAPPVVSFDMEDLKIGEQLCRGRYSEVWKGYLNETPVAVKVLHYHYRQHYLNEKYIYTLPFMEHENILKFYGAEERITQDGLTKFMIVLSYVPHGSLQSYLKLNKLDWNTFCKMCLTLARGLIHLHTDIRKGDLFKPTVAHRDINSKNILVNNDLSCVIGDLGFAITTMGSKLIRYGHYENAEQSSLQDVGTLRYMAPELLDGAANLRESETSLKQIDIYSLGLVIWEMAVRCTDLYHGVPVPEYQLPYQKEAGVHPTFEEMTILVSRNKVRPQFPEVWRDYSQVVRALKDTVEDCWDHDAEARLTAMCVEERILDMMSLWEQEIKLKGITPTITTTSNLFEGSSVGGENIRESLIAPVMDTHITVDTRDTVPNPELGNSTAPLILSSPNLYPNGDIVQQTPHPFGGITMSSSTTDTFVPFSPSESEPPQKLSNIALEKNNAGLYQPHQGRNPTFERNTHKSSDEELAISGNRILYGNDKSEDDSVQSVPNRLSEDLFDSFGDNLETSLVQNDILNQHRNPPIPYVQNQVHDQPSGVVRPKMANIQGVTNLVQNRTANQKETKPSKYKFGLFKKPIDISRIGLFAKRHFKSGSSTKKHSENSNSTNVQTTNGINSNTGFTNLGQGHKNDNVNRPVSTEVRVQNGTAFVQPANPQHGNASTSLNDTSNFITHSSKYPENKLGVAEIGIARLEMLPKRTIVKIRKGPYSKSTSDLSPEKVSGRHCWSETGFGDKNCKLRRPNSLSLKGHNYHLDPRNQSDDRHNIMTFSKNADKNMSRSNSREKIKRRVKTPLSLKHGRFSLYDDRLMTQFVIENPDLIGEPQVRAKSSESVNGIDVKDNNCNLYKPTNHYIM